MSGEYRKKKLKEQEDYWKDHEFWWLKNQGLLEGLNNAMGLSSGAAAGGGNYLYKKFHVKPGIYSWTGYVGANTLDWTSQNSSYVSGTSSDTDSSGHVGWYNASANTELTTYETGYGDNFAYTSNVSNIHFKEAGTYLVEITLNAEDLLLNGSTSFRAGSWIQLWKKGPQYDSDFRNDGVPIGNKVYLEEGATSFDNDMVQGILHTETPDEEYRVGVRIYYGTGGSWTQAKLVEYKHEIRRLAQEIPDYVFVEPTLEADELMNIEMVKYETESFQLYVGKTVGSADFSVDWGDGNITTHTTGGAQFIKHKYTTSGLFRVSVKMINGYSTDDINLINLRQEVGTRVREICLQGINVDTLYLTDISNSSQHMIDLKAFSFIGANNITDPGFDMFYGAINLEKIWELDTSTFTTFYVLFYGLKELTSIPELAADNVTNADFMFTNTINGRQSITSLITNNIEVNLNVSYLTLPAESLNALFTSLGDGTGKTITITGNYGAATCDTSIATNKNWTVVN